MANINNINFKKKKQNIVFNILTVLGYFYGLFLISTLILIPVGVYAIISAHRYSAYADLSPLQLYRQRNIALRWVVFGAILYFPFGLIGLLCLDILNAKNESDLWDDAEIIEPKDAPADEQTEKNDKPATEVETHNPITMAEKAEKLEKLKRFKENGLITEEEYKQAVEQLKQED